MAHIQNTVMRPMDHFYMDDGSKLAISVGGDADQTRNFISIGLTEDGKGTIQHFMSLELAQAVADSLMKYVANALDTRNRMGS